MRESNPNKALVRDVLRRAPGRARRPARGGRERSIAHVLFVSSLLGLLLATGLFIGAPVLAPLIGSKESENAAAVRTGKIVLPLPDDTNCRQLMFDNYTGALREGATRPCVDSPPESRRSVNGFMWGR